MATDRRVTHKVGELVVRNDSVIKMLPIAQNRCAISFVSNDQGYSDWLLDKCLRPIDKNEHSVDLDCLVYVEEFSKLLRQEYSSLIGSIPKNLAKGKNLPSMSFTFAGYRFDEPLICSLKLNRFEYPFIPKNARTIFKGIRLSLNTGIINWSRIYSEKQEKYLRGVRTH